MSAKTNISKLPEWAYAVNLIDGSLVRIRAGESGFYHVPGEELTDTALSIGTNLPVTNNGERRIAMQTYVDWLNRGKNITKAQAEAMSIGSQFGWEVPGADPDNYDDNGEYIK